MFVQIRYLADGVCSEFTVSLVEGNAVQRPLLRLKIKSEEVSFQGSFVFLSTAGILSLLQ